MDKLKVLLIDQDEFSRNITRDIFLIFGKNKFSITSVDGPGAVEEYLKENIPDIILMDLVFRKNGWVSTDIGLDLLKKLKDDSRLVKTKIFIYSGYVDLRNKALSLGADAFIIKGAHIPNELIEIVYKNIHDLSPT